MTPFVEVRSLRKSFGTVDAVNGISFSVRKGEVLGFLGPNGAGKTTTMKIITGFMPATAGEVKICGHDVGSAPMSAKRHIGYLPEGAPLYGDMTPHALLEFTASIRHLPRTSRARRIEEVVDILELAQVLPRRIDTLSKGFKRRVGLAQAVLHDPDVLILDEPTDGLDPNQKHHVRGLIREMGATKAIIISTHLLEEVDAVCDRAVIIDRGRIVLEGTPAELHAQANDANAAFVRVREAEVSRAIEIISAIPAFEAVIVEERLGGTALLRATVGHGTVSLAAACNALIRAGVEVLELRSGDGSLDQVFRMVTGGSGQAATQG